MSRNKNITKSQQKIKLGVFFSHPTQHHAPMFKHLSNHPQFDVKVYYYDPQEGMHDAGFGRTETWDIDLNSGFEPQVLNNWFRGKTIRTTRQFNPSVIKLLRQEAFDAIFISGYVTPSNWFVVMLAKALGVHILYQSDTNILDEQRKRRNVVQRLFRNIILRQMDTLLAAGNKNREFYIACGLNSQRILWCPIPVDVERFTASDTSDNVRNYRCSLRKKFDIPPNAKVLIFSGKLIERKRPQDLITAVRQLNRTDTYAILVGSGIMEESLRHSLQPNDQIRLAGFVNQQAMPELIRGADIGVVTSEWDPHPLVVTEFAACGLPIVVSHYAGVWGDHDILRPQENGLVYKCGNIPELAECLNRILDDEPLRQSMGKRSCELAKEQSARFAADTITNHLLQVIQKQRDTTPIQ